VNKAAHVTTGKPATILSDMPQLKLAVVLLVIHCVFATHPDRMPDIPFDKQTPEQQEATTIFEKRRGEKPFGPYIPLLRSPTLMLATLTMGEYLRFNSSLPHRISEFTIITTARYYTQQTEFFIHAPISVKVGVPQQVVDAIKDGRRPIMMDAELSLVYEFCHELFIRKSVSDYTYEQVVNKYGVKGVIDITGIVGYYSYLALIMNMARTALPKGAVPPLELFPN
jgi:4-carboxymuconolactone decarboxylase